MKIAKEFILREIAGETILVPVGTGSQDLNGMISLSGIGRFIWENIEKTDSFSELVELIYNEYDAEPDVIAKDAFEFIAQLLAHGFVEKTKEDATW